MSKSIIKLYNADCLDILKDMPENLVDMVFTDLPYGTTACKWDSIIPFDLMWKYLNKIVKDNGAMIFTASQPFTSQLVCSNIKNFKCEWIYKKKCASNFAQAKYMPMKEHESVLIFSNGKTNYYPIKEERQGSGKERSKYKFSDKSRHQCGEFIGNLNGEYDKENDSGNDELRYPSSVQEFNNRAKGDRGLHPTQKPVTLCKYFIETYSKENDIILDFTMGSGTTGVASVELNRGFIGIEKEPKYFEIAKERIYGASKI